MQVWYSAARVSKWLNGQLLATESLIARWPDQL